MPSACVAGSSAGATMCRTGDLPTQSQSASTALRLRMDARRPIRATSYLDVAVAVVASAANAIVPMGRRSCRRRSCVGGRRRSPVGRTTRPAPTVAQPSRRRSPLASNSVCAHLVRGAAGLLAAGIAIGLLAVIGAVWLVLLPLTAFAWRGCPTCWTVGLLGTLADASRAQRGRGSPRCIGGHTRARGAPASVYRLLRDRPRGTARRTRYPEQARCGARTRRGRFSPSVT